VAYTLENGANGSAVSAPFDSASTTAFSSSIGTLMIVVVGSHTGTPIQTPTDNAGNTYVPVTSEFSTSNEFQRWFMCVGYTPNALHVVTVSGTQNPSIIAMCVSGNAAAPAGSSNNNGATSSSTVQTGSLTPANTGSLLLAACSSAFDNINSVDGSWTIVLNQAAGYGKTGLALAYLNPAGAGPENPTFTLASSVSAVQASIVEFLPAGGGGGRIFKLAGEGGGLAGPSRGLVAHRVLG